MNLFNPTGFIIFFTLIRVNTKKCYFRHRECRLRRKCRNPCLNELPESK